jgi:hypothetical protein
VIVVGDRAAPRESGLEQLQGRRVFAGASRDTADRGEAAARRAQVPLDAGRAVTN